MMPFPLTLDAVLNRAARCFPATALVAPPLPGAGAAPAGLRRSIGAGPGVASPRHPLNASNYAELARRARGLAAGLRALELPAGARVATLLWNRIEHLEAAFAVPLAGGIVHPLNPRLHPRQIAAILRDAGDSLVLVEDALADVWGAIARELDAPPRAIIGTEALEPLWEHEPTELPALDENDGAVLAYTSGTTGEPKGVVYTHRALALHALATALPDAMNLRADDCVMSLVAMFHANAWGIPVTATMIGCKQVLSGVGFDAPSALDLLAGEQVTFSAGAPVVWSAILDALEREPGRWRLHPGLRVNLGGAPASVALMRRFDRLGIGVNMGWGMTEMTPVGAMNPLFAPRAGAGGAEDDHGVRTRQGRPLPFVETRTAPDGELEVRGPWVADRYFSGGHSDTWTEDGWLRTGDVVRFDAEGLMEIVDRKKDMIRSGGEWISSVAIEGALAGHPDVRQAAVIAVPDPKWQERPLALVVLCDGARVNPEAWSAHLSASGFARWQCPDAYVQVDTLPLTATGKIDKRALRARYTCVPRAPTER